MKLKSLEWGCGAKLDFNEAVKVSDPSFAEEFFALSIPKEESTFGTRRLQAEESESEFKLKVDIASDGKSITYKAVLTNPYDIGVGSSISLLSVQPVGDPSFLSGKNGPIILPKMDELPTLTKQLPA